MRFVVVNLNEKNLLFHVNQTKIFPLRKSNLNYSRKAERENIE